MRLDDVTKVALEYPSILEMLARRTTTPMGRERALELEPSPDPDEIRRRQAQTSQVRALLELGGVHASIPLGVPDAREALRRAASGGTLTGEELQGVASAVEGVARLRAYLERETAPDGAAPVLRPFISTLPDASEIAAAIRHDIGPDGEVADAASPVLAAIRGRIRRAEERVHEELERLVRSPLGRKALQQAVVTRRGGRYVVPVRQECRESVPGIVHDASDSGATLFIEPLAVVEANNALRTEKAKEHEEVERILRALSGRVGQRSAELLGALDAVGECDAIAARARLSLDQGAVEPLLDVEHGYTCLREARHPLLGPGVVPIDMEVGDTFWVLVVTGPNTGGKTVSLKTLGLLTLMAQAGLHVPAAPGARVAVFDRVWSDIGDRQSLVDNLSTFSAHLSRIIPILMDSDRHSLVLLDELGAGTDPEEGAALGCAILERLRVLGARVVVTTHLGALKAMAHTTPGMANASVSFDVETLSPTFRLTIGAPGPSQALVIAQRLGLPADVASDARQRLGSERLRVDALIAELQETLERARQRLAEADAAREQARRRALELREQLERLRAKRVELMERLRSDGGRLVAESRRQLEAILSEARQAAQARQQQDLQRLRETILESGRRLDRELAGMDATAREEEAAAGAGLPSGEAGGVLDPAAGAAGEPGPALLAAEAGKLEAGQAVWVIPLRSAGRVIEAADESGAVLVQVGPIRTRVPCERLAHLPEARDSARSSASGEPPSRSGGALAAAQGVAKAATLSPELDVRGLTVDEAMRELDKYLDDCVLAGVQRVRIIHGKGTGALRDGLRVYLRRSARVQRFVPGAPHEGGDGVTVVELD